MMSPGALPGEDNGVAWAEACGWQAVSANTITRNGHLTTDSTVQPSRDYAPKHEQEGLPRGPRYNSMGTWGLAIFIDQPGTPHANEFDVSYHGDWSPFFDQLPDLAAT